MITTHRASSTTGLYWSVLCAIAARENLKEVLLQHEVDADDFLSLPFLEAVQSNANVERITFSCFRFVLGSDHFTISSL